MSLTADDHVAVGDFLRDLEMGVERAAPAGIGSGSFGYGAGGPVHLDDFKSKRPPTKAEMVNAYKAVAFACIDLNANAVARVPLRLYGRTRKGEGKADRFWSTRRVPPERREQLRRRLDGDMLTRGLIGANDEVDEVVDPEHPILAALSRPNPYFDGNQLLQHVARSLDIVGEAHWMPERLGPEFAPTELWPLHSQYVFPVKGAGNRIVDRWTYFSDEIPFEDLIWFRFVSLRDPYMSGYGPLHAGFEQLGLGGYYMATVESLLRKGTRVDAVVGPKDSNQPWGKVEQKRVEALLNGKFGQGNQGGVLAVNGAFDIKPVAYPDADLGGLEVMKFARLMAANCFGVPITMLETESSNKATASEGTIQHQRNAVSPRCVIIQTALTMQLAQRIDPRLFFAFDNPVDEDKKVDADVDAIYLDRGVYVPNEVRARQGMPPRDGGDEPINRLKPGDEKGAKPRPGKDDDE